MTALIPRSNLAIAPELLDFVEREALPGSDVTAEVFWEGLSQLVTEFGPRIEALLARRAALQEQIDDWHRTHTDADFDAAAYEAFLTQIGYLVPSPAPFEIQTENLDPEISSIPGPQLVVPITNARYVLNAANARFGSLYDALYGTDALGDLPHPERGFDHERAKRVVAWAKSHMDAAVPLAQGRWADIKSLHVQDGALSISLSDPSQFIGWKSSGDATHYLFEKHGLKIEIIVDKSHIVGAEDPAHIADIRLESAVSAIMDCEDSVACVDAEDKVTAYRNWLGLMRGDLSAEVTKGAKRFTRSLVQDDRFETPSGAELIVKRRALMLVRNVGHLMTTPAVLDGTGEAINEGLLDAIMTVLLAKHDLAAHRNTQNGSIYVVKPKMHGPDEVAVTNEIFGRVETLLGLAPGSVKLGIMDEERRTSANLAACIAAAKERVAFINTGFLDRTGDEIHTSMYAGTMVAKTAMKGEDWISAYERRNVQIGLSCGFRGRAQIGKGMWAIPDQMGDMLDQKIGHPQSGANCAWVPSPTAATLHATHYHLVDVSARQAALLGQSATNDIAALLHIPLAREAALQSTDIQAELENNVQGILGYVVRWVDQGVGCSKVPDINNVGLMEDRATCRISAQALANWLMHGVISTEQVDQALRKMAVIVDRQNASDPTYRPMAPAFDGFAFQAARDLIVEGARQPSGYTEPLLHQYRLKAKAQEE